MGSYDGAKIFQLVDLYMLNEMKMEFSHANFGLCRNNVMGVYTILPELATERLRKDII